jgi:hypothetical protein
MMEQIKTQLWNLVTEPDNKTLCPIKVAAMIAMGEWLVMQPMSFIHTHTLDPVAFGTGFGALVAGVGVALGMKKDSPVN